VSPSNGRDATADSTDFSLLSSSSVEDRKDLWTSERSTNDSLREVRLSDTPYADGFDTERFYVFDVVAARPIKQTYHIGNEEFVFRKDSTELRDAAWSLENAPFTLGHPNTAIAQSISDVHGFVRNVEYTADYDDNGDALHGSLYVPVTDDTAVEYIREYGDVSVGFHNQLDFEGAYGDVDAVQRNLLFDHLAGVKHGRCSEEDGCGIDVSESDFQLHSGSTAVEMDLGVGCSDGPCSCGLHADVTEGAQTAVGADASHSEDLDLFVPDGAQTAAQNFLDAVERGDVPSSCGGPNGLGRRRASQFADGGELSLETWVTGGTSAVANWHSRHEGNESYDESDVETPWENCGYAMFKAWGGDAARNKASRLKSQYEEMNTDVSYDAPSAVGDWVTWEDGAAHGKIDEVVRDGCVSRGKGDMEVCAEEDDPATVVEVYDSESGESKDIFVRHKMSTLNAWSNPPTSDSMTYTDDTIMDTIEYDGTKGGKLVESEIPSDGFSRHYVFDGEVKSESSFPLVDADGNLRRGNVKAAFDLRGHADNESMLLDVLSTANQQFDSPPIDEAKLSETMSDSDTPDGDGIDTKLSIDSVVSSMSLDSLAEHHEGVSELRAARDSQSDTIEVLEDEKESLEDDLEDARSTIEDFENGDRRPKSDLITEITEMTDAWDAEDLRDLDREALEDKKETVEAVATSPSTPVPDEPTADGGSDGSPSASASASDDGRTISDEFRSWG